MSLLDMILERELTPEQREARRARAKARREKRKAEASSSSSEKPKKDREPAPDSYVDITGSFIAKYWAIYNDKYFDGKLKRPRAFFPSSGKGNLGTCSSDFDPVKEQVFCMNIRINTRIENYITFRNTLVHEMVHQWAYQSLDENDIRSANQYGMARSRRWWKALTSPMGKDGHHGIWLTKCEALMSKFPYLNLKKFGSKDEIELDDDEVKEVVKKNNNCHIVLCEPGNRSRKFFYYITDSGFKELKREIEDGIKPGRWTEYEFDPVKLAQEKLTPTNYASGSAWRGSYLDNLMERGVVKSWPEKHIGGEKAETQPRRRRRFSLGNGIFW
jgi:hypothetical protein